MFDLLDKTEKKLLTGAIALVIALAIFILLKPFTTISAGQRGIVLNWGAFNGAVLQPGLNWKTPIAQSVIKIDVQTQKDEVEASAASKDLQNVTTKIALNYHLQPEQVGALYQNIGLDYDSRVIDPAVQEAIKSVTSKFTAEELITHRQEVKDQVKAMLVERLSKQFISVDEVSIVNFSFSQSFEQAIEAKVTAEQNALAQKNKLEQVKYEAQQQIETAKAQAESIKIQATAINAQGGADYVKLQAIGKWDGHLPTSMPPNGTVPFIDLSK